jgi:predicted TIM-barrel fold metal-dependent hydrolase
MAVYDIHQHLLPEAVLRGLAARRSPPCLRGRRLELASEPPSSVDPALHDLDARLRAMDDAGIDVALVSLAPTLGLPADLVEAYHVGILELAAASSGRLLPLAHEAALPGFAGACAAAQALVDLDHLAPLADQLEREGRLLFVHPGPAGQARGPSWWPALVDYTAQMQAAYFAWLAEGVRRWPRLRVVFALLAGGGPFQLERFRSRGGDVRTALRPTLFLDTSSYGRRALELSLATFGVEQLVFGSDFPVLSAEAGLREVRGFGETVALVICQHNPSRLLAP